MIGKVKDIIEDEEFAVAMIQIPKSEVDRMWKMVGKEVAIAWVKT